MKGHVEGQGPCFPKHPFVPMTLDIADRTRVRSRPKQSICKLTSSLFRVKR